MNKNLWLDSEENGLAIQESFYQEMLFLAKDKREEMQIRANFFPITEVR